MERSASYSHTTVENKWEKNNTPGKKCESLWSHLRFVRVLVNNNRLLASWKCLLTCFYLVAIAVCVYHSLNADIVLCATVLEINKAVP